MEQAQDAPHKPRKKPRTILKELRKELRYFQERVRIDLAAVESGKAKVKEIAAKMREQQQKL